MSNNTKQQTAVMMAIDLINQYWTFDEFQHPKSGWHDKQGLIAKIQETLLPAERKQIEEAYRKGVEDERYDAVDFINKDYYTQNYGGE